MESDKTREHPLGERAPAQRETAYFIVLSGKAIGRMFKLLGDEMLVGRSPDAHVTLEDDGVSRRHARIERTREGALRIVDLQSTNGTWVEGERVDARILRDGDQVGIGSDTVLKFSYQDELEERFQQQLYDSATRDDLTRLYNKRFFLERLEQEVSFGLRHGQPLSLLLFDVDHFKRLNDSYGHPAGDEVLRALAERVAETMRTEDVLCRYGGEEFGIIMRESSAERGRRVAERVRSVVAARPFDAGGEPVEVTISLGLATLDPRRHATAADLVAEADRLLYEAKEGGRNQVALRPA